MTDDLVTRSAQAVERLMDLEDKPYFTNGRGPSPVYEIRSVIQEQAAEITRLKAVIAAKDWALDKIATHESTVDDGHMECANCKDAHLDDYFSVNAFARAALSREPAQTGGEGA